MRICLIGDYGENIDEGMRKISFYLAQELSKRHKLLILDPKNVLTRDFWRSLKNFQPQIIHYIPGPSIYSFIIMKTIKSHFWNAKTVMSAIHPAFYGFRAFYYGHLYVVSSIFKNFIPLLKPDLILTQSYETEKMFTDLGCKTEFLHSGVDLKKFSPVSRKMKEELRERYKIDKRKFVVLHIGPIKRRRNIQVLKKLQKNDYQVIIVGSTYSKVEWKIYRELETYGCLVWFRYFPDIKEIYNLSDCYIFPTVDRESSIELPLSVLEAMACNLPVISTKFGALSRCFNEGDGLFFAERVEEFAQILERIKNNNIKIRTREKVSRYSWENIAMRLEKIYRYLLLQR